MMYRQSPLFISEGVGWLKDALIAFTKDDRVAGGTGSPGRVLATITVTGTSITIVLGYVAPGTLQAYEKRVTVTAVGEGLFEESSDTVYLLIDAAELVDVADVFEFEPYVVLVDDDLEPILVNGLTLYTTDEIPLSLSEDALSIDVIPPPVTTLEVEELEGLSSLNGILPSGGNIDIEVVGAMEIQVEGK